ncbi:hypothetical protein QCA50_008494 [Cerrena zonata]|uniref:Vps72/YL1 C-terminal domain-containing protein n=1 Tax=Cerrena zonata TaxID=2478898 RepID=A0AAW0G939_9APHY
MADEDSLVMRRPKRSTAGNRMEAALAEFKAEDVGIDQDEDADFAVIKDEEDAFESDFESTDDEGAQEDVDAVAEKMIREEERTTKKDGKTQLERITAAAHARQAATFNPQLHVEPVKKQPKPRRRVSMGVVVDAATGEVLEGASQESNAGKRKSRRMSTIMNRTATEHRLRDAERKSGLYKKQKIKIKTPTQAELIARALDMEEGNIIEHREYLSVEEEKRRKARVIRKNVEGPLLRWISKVEEIKVEIPPPPPPPPPPAPVYTSQQSPGFQYGYSYPGPSTPNGYYPTPSTPPAPYSKPQAIPFTLSASTSGSLAQTTSSYPPFSAPYSSSYPPQSSVFHTSTPYTYSPHPQPPPPSTTPLSTPTPQKLEPEYRMEKVSKAYLIHELSQSENAPRPPWSTTMRALFGNHVNWDEVKVYVGKGRPLSRPIPTCPITGRPARYLDPRTGVPYADKYAWDTLTNILHHYYVWSENLGCYIAYMPLSAAQESKAAGEDEMEVDPTMESTKGKGKMTEPDNGSVDGSVIQATTIRRKRSRASVT